jgi:hypothetical protein
VSFPQVEMRRFPPPYQVTRVSHGMGPRHVVNSPDDMADLALAVDICQVGRDSEARTKEEIDDGNQERLAKEKTLLRPACLGILRNFRLVVVVVNDKLRFFRALFGLHTLYRLRCPK